MKKFFELLKYGINRYVLKNLYTVLNFLFAIASVVFIFVPLQSGGKDYRWIALICLLAVALIAFVANAAILKYKSKIDIKINGTDVRIVFGDIFDNSQFVPKGGAKVYRVIGVNDFFDTHVGDGVIDENSLHGKFLKRFNISCEDLQARIAADAALKNEICCTTEERQYGNNIKYNLGSIFKDEKTDCILVAISRFNKNNNAELTNSELMQCYLKMWEEIKRVKESRGIVIPLLGASGNIKTDVNLSVQEILETLLHSVKLSNLRIGSPARLTVVLNKQLKQSFDLQRIKYIF